MVFLSHAAFAVCQAIAGALGYCGEEEDAEDEDEDEKGKAITTEYEDFHAASGTFCPCCPHQNQKTKQLGHHRFASNAEANAVGNWYQQYMMRKVLQRWTQRNLHGAFAAWLDYTEERIRVRPVFDPMSMSMVGRRFDWQVRELCQRLLRRLQHGQLSEAIVH